MLKEHGIGLKKTITSYPSVKKDLTSDFKYNEDDTTVIVDGKLSFNLTLERLQKYDIM